MSGVCALHTVLAMTLLSVLSVQSVHAAERKPGIPEGFENAERVVLADYSGPYEPNKFELYLADGVSHRQCAEKEDVEWGEADKCVWIQAGGRAYQITHYSDDELDAFVMVVATKHQDRMHSLAALSVRRLFVANDGSFHVRLALEPSLESRSIWYTSQFRLVEPPNEVEDGLEPGLETQWTRAPFARVDEPECKIDDVISIMSDRCDRGRALVTLQPGSTVRLLLMATDHSCEKYRHAEMLVETPSGMIGWAQIPMNVDPRYQSAEVPYEVSCIYEPYSP